MPTSATGPRNKRPDGRKVSERLEERGFARPLRSAEHGFTLVELMVVIAVVGVAAAAVAWALPDPAGRVADEASRFALHVRSARDVAITGGRPVGLWVGTGGYGFDVRQGDGQGAGGWRALGRPLDVERWGAGTGVTLDDAAPRVRVVFDTTGLADRPLEVRLRRRAAQASVRIGADGGVAIGG